jgi:hypothetical protein
MGLIPPKIYYSTLRGIFAVADTVRVTGITFQYGTFLRRRLTVWCEFTQ